MKTKAAPIRAIFIRKEKKWTHSDPAAWSDEPTEFIAALRAKPSAKTIAKVKKALRGRFSCELTSDSLDDPDDPCPDVRILHFELAERKPSLAFKPACLDALRAMNLSAKGGAFCIPLVYPACKTMSYANMENLPIPERIEWFRGRMRDTVMASSCSLDRALLLSYLATHPSESQENSSSKSARL